jgi:hypothetical protein
LRPRRARAVGEGELKLRVAADAVANLDTEALPGDTLDGQFAVADHEVVLGPPVGVADQLALAS